MTSGYFKFKKIELHFDLCNWALPISIQYSIDAKLLFIQVLFITIIL
jgi:hypothetical protein